MIKLIDEKNVITNKGIFADCDVDSEKGNYIEIVKYNIMENTFLIIIQENNYHSSIGLKKETLLTLIETIKNNIDNMVN